jgi:signal transduction histidine kinase
MKIRTPLNAVQGATTLLQDTSPLTDEQRELLALLDAGSAHVVLIVEDILLHGALNSGKFPVVQERLTLLSSVIEPAMITLALQPSMQDKLERITLTRTVAPDVPVAIMGDASRLLQVLINLLRCASVHSSRVPPPVVAHER